eukprot:3377079-Prymnesium_polylepis.2
MRRGRQGEWRVASMAKRSPRPRGRGVQTWALLSTVGGCSVAYSQLAEVRGARKLGTLFVTHWEQLFFTLGGPGEPWGATTDPQGRAPRRPNGPGEWKTTAHERGALSGAHMKSETHIVSCVCAAACTTVTYTAAASTPWCGGCLPELLITSILGPREAIGSFIERIEHRSTRRSAL